MALLRSNIHKALARHLNDNFSKSSDVIWENVKKNLNVSSTYFRETYIPNDTEQKTLGSSGETEDFGLYQIDVLVPVGTSTIPTEEFIEELSILFKSGTHLIESGVDVLIEKTTAAQGFNQDNWYTTPFTISWSCYLPIN